MTKIVVVSAAGNESELAADDGRADEADDTDEAEASEGADDGAAGDDAESDAEADAAVDAESEATLDESTEGSADTGGVWRSEQAATHTVQLDGACTAEVDTELSVDDLRAWQLPECEWAPIDPGQHGEWILVVLSLNGNDFGAAEAGQRARDVGLPGRVLWSSHYPSLNPVVGRLRRALQQ